MKIYKCTIYGLIPILQCRICKDKINIYEFPPSHVITFDRTFIPRSQYKAFYNASNMCICNVFNIFFFYSEIKVFIDIKKCIHAYNPTFLTSQYNKSFMNSFLKIRNINLSRDILMFKIKIVGDIYM